MVVQFCEIAQEVPRRLAELAQLFVGHLPEPCFATHQRPRLPVELIALLVAPRSGHRA
jgi:hypothetical protein